MAGRAKGHCRDCRLVRRLPLDVVGFSDLVSRWLSFHCRGARSDRATLRLCVELRPHSL